MGPPLWALFPWRCHGCQFSRTAAGGPWLWCCVVQWRAPGEEWATKQRGIPHPPVLLFIPFEPKRRRESSSRTHRVEVLIFVLIVTCQWVLFTQGFVSVVRNADIPDRTACVCSSAEWSGAWWGRPAACLAGTSYVFVYFYTITDSRQAKHTIIPHRLTHSCKTFCPSVICSQLHLRGGRKPVVSAVKADVFKDIGF